jgi:beta propeller repeat protein
MFLFLIFFILFSNSFILNQFHYSKTERNNFEENKYHSIISSEIYTENSEQETDTGIQITFDTSNQVNPQIYKNIIVWEDSRNEDGDGLNGDNTDIYGYDLLTNKEFPICTNGSAQKHPKISGDKVVWEDWRNDPDDDVGGNYFNCDIYLYDLTTKEEKQITTDPSDQYHPDIFENIIVWDDFRDDNSAGPNDQNIYFYDLITNEEGIITDAYRSQVNPEISGKNIVWEDWRLFGISNIFYYDIEQEEEKSITRDRNYQFDPEVYQDNIVWVDTRNGDYDIYLYDLENNLEKQITTDSANQYDVSIFDNIIVWTDERNRNDENEINPDIYGYNLETDEELLISTSNDYEGLPSIYGDYIVCMGDRGGNADIFLYEVSSFNIGSNKRPIINSIVASPEIVTPGQSVSITVDAHDEDGDDLHYNYECSGGSFLGSGSTVTWIAPEKYSEYLINVSVSDSIISSIPESIEIIVTDNTKINNENLNDDDSNSKINQNEGTTVSENNIFLIFLGVALLIIIIMIFFIYDYKTNQ